MIVEFFGHAGAGKTTVAELISEEYGIPIAKIRSRSKLLYFNFIFKIKHPVKFFGRFFYVIGNSINLKMFYYKFMNAFMQVNAKHQKALRFKGPVILDQGYLQSAMSMFEYKVSKAELQKYFKNILWPDKLVIFEASEEIIKNRLKERGYRVRQFLSEEYLKEREKIVEHNDKVFKNLAPSFPCQVLTVDATQLPAEIAKKIFNFIKS